ncbi:unnamed protein product [Closterium sp. NIES-54]
MLHHVLQPGLSLLHVLEVACQPHALGDCDGRLVVHPKDSRRPGVQLPEFCKEEHLAARARLVLLIAGIVGVHVADQLQRLCSTAELQGGVMGVGELGEAAVDLAPVLVAPHGEAAPQLAAGEGNVRSRRRRRELQRADLLPVLLLLAFLRLLVVEGELSVGVDLDRRLRGAPGLLLVEELPTQLVGVALLVQPQLPRRPVADDLQPEVLLHRRDLAHLEGGLQQLLQSFSVSVLLLASSRSST